MSLIIPKKPQILYAPMLGSLGGGSVRGFGRGVGGGKYAPSWNWSLGTTYSFNSATARGSLGPTYSMASAEYSGSPFLSTTDDFDVLGEGIQKLTIPVAGTYRLTVKGAYGGPGENQSDLSDAGGRPYEYVVDASLEKGDVLGLVVGQRGGESNGSYSSSVAGGGGGASWVFKWDEAAGDEGSQSNYFNRSDVTPLVIAAGGGGSNWSQWNNNAGADALDHTYATTTDRIPSLPAYQTKVGGRGAYGASWKTTPYYFYGQAGDWNIVDSRWSSTNVHQDYSAGKEYRYGAPALDLNGNLHVEAFRGGLSFEASTNSYYTRFDNRWDGSGGLGGSAGGFGGGGGTQYEGGGGGGYWGGVAPGENDYNVNYSNSPYRYGAVSYVDSSLTQVSNTLVSSASTSQRYTYSNSNVPPSVLMGAISLRRVS
jgi:hypothetical protein